MLQHEDIFGMKNFILNIAKEAKVRTHPIHLQKCKIQNFLQTGMEKKYFLHILPLTKMTHIITLSY